MLSSLFAINNVDDTAISISNQNNNTQHKTSHHHSLNIPVDISAEHTANVGEATMLFMAQRSIVIYTPVQTNI